MFVSVTQIYDEESSELLHYIDGFEETKANWMRNVNPAYSSGSQNLIACQVNRQVYFYTIRPVMQNEELLVWYCKEFAERLNYPPTGELMLERISKYTPFTIGCQLDELTSKPVFFLQRSR